MEKVGDALNKFLKAAKWKGKVDELKVQEGWEAIMGKTIAKYTHQVTLYDGVLVIYTRVAPLKQELKMAEALIIQNINQHFQEEIVKKIVIK